MREVAKVSEKSLTKGRKRDKQPHSSSSSSQSKSTAYKSTHKQRERERKAVERYSHERTFSHS